MKIKLNIPTVYECEGVTLVSGENEVPDKSAEKFMSNPLVKADIESGKVEVVKAEKASGSEKKS